MKPVLEYYLQMSETRYCTVSDRFCIEDLYANRYTTIQLGHSANLAK